MHFHAYVLVPFNVKDVEEKVSELMAPYDANLESIPYPRECECIYDSAFKKLEGIDPNLNCNVKPGSVIEFRKASFDGNGPELLQKLELLRLGNPDPACGYCNGSGIFTTTHNCFSEWDRWEMGFNVGTGESGCCIDLAGGFPSGQWIFPVCELDLDRISIPRTVVTPDGIWHSYMKYIWFCNAAIVDEHWKDTVMGLLNAHMDAALVIVNYHI